jgi:carbon starvation protein
VGGLSGSLPIQYQGLVGIHSETAGFIFPALFITVACGSVSGFHSIVSSGTTAKQLPDESAARPIAYGAMLTEAGLAVLAMATVMVLSGTPAEVGAVNPMIVFSQGIGRFLGTLGIGTQWGTVFGLLAVSTFLLTTLDTCTRLTRYIVEEFFDLKGAGWRYATTTLSIAPLLYFSFKTYPNPADPAAMIPAWRVIWPAFGTTNQLLAALALLVVVVWRRGQGRSYWFALWPMLFMLATTCTSMVQLTVQHLGEGGTPIIAWVNIVMLAMTALLVADTVWNWGRLGRRAQSGAAEAT